MTIERSTSYLQGLIETQRVVLKSGESEVISGFNPCVEIVRVLDDDTLTITSANLPNRIYYKEEINQADIRKNPTLGDLLTGKEIVYTWRSGIPVKNSSRTPQKVRLRFQPNNA